MNVLVSFSHQHSFISGGFRSPTTSKPTPRTGDSFPTRPPLTGPLPRVSGAFVDNPRRPSTHEDPNPSTEIPTGISNCPYSFPSGSPDGPLTLSDITILSKTTSKVCSLHPLTNFSRGPRGRARTHVEEVVSQLEVTEDTRSVTRSETPTSLLSPFTVGSLPSVPSSTLYSLVFYWCRAHPGSPPFLP